MCVTVDWVWIGWLDLLTTYTRLGTINYSTNASLPCCKHQIFTSRSLATYSNRDSSASRVHSLLCRTACQLLTHDECRFWTYSISADRVGNIPFPDNTRIIALVSIAPGTCLPSCSLATIVSSGLLRICRLATDVVLLFVLRPLPNNSLYATIH
jgi:hypothetical protein